MDKSPNTSLMQPLSRSESQESTMPAAPPSTPQRQIATASAVTPSGTQLAVQVMLPKQTLGQEGSVPKTPQRTLRKWSLAEPDPADFYVGLSGMQATQYGRSSFGAEKSSLLKEKSKPEPERLMIVGKTAQAAFALRNYKGSLDVHDVGQWQQDVQNAAPAHMHTWILSLLPFLHTKEELTLQGMGTAFSSVNLGEHLLLGTQTEGALHPQEITIEIKNDRLFLRDQKKFFKYNFFPPTGGKDVILTGPDQGKSPVVTSTFTHCFRQDDIYDLRHDFLSAILGEDIDTAVGYSNIVMANKLIEALENPIDQLEKPKKSRNEFESVDLDAAGEVTPSPVRIRSLQKRMSFAGFPIGATSSLPEYFGEFQRKDFQHFTKPSWRAYLKQLSKKNNTSPDLDTTKLVFWANTIVFSDEYAQHAVCTQEEILAGAFVELAVLYHIQGALESSQLFALKEFQIGLRITLQRYVENPLSHDNRSEKLQDYINNLNNVELKFDDVKEIVNDLIEQFHVYFSGIKKYYGHLQERSPVILWNNIKLMLRDVDLASQLEELAGHTENSVLEIFAKEYAKHIASDVLARNFSVFLNKARCNVCELVEAIITSLRALSSSVTYHYRDFAIFSREKRSKSGDLSIKDFFDRYIVEPFRVVKVYVTQLKALNACYMLEKSFNEEEFKLQRTNVRALISPLEKPYFKYDPKCEEDEAISSALEQWQEKQLFPAVICDGLTDVCVQMALKLHDITTAKSMPVLSTIVHHVFEQLSDIGRINNSADTLENITTYFSRVYYASIELDNFYIIFNKFTDSYLEKIRSYRKQGIFFPRYAQALFLRHLYIAFSAHYVSFENFSVDKDRPEFMYHHFLCNDTEWVKFFCSGVIAENSVAVCESIRAVANHINMVQQPNGGKYVQTLTMLLEKKNFPQLSEQSEALLRMCAWLATLVYSKLFSDENIQFIEQQIVEAIKYLKTFASEEQQGDIEIILTIWRAYKFLDDSCKKTVESWRELQGKSSTRLLPSTPTLNADANFSSPTPTPNSHHSHVSSYILHSKGGLLLHTSPLTSSRNSPTVSAFPSEDRVEETTNIPDAFDQLARYRDVQISLWRHVATTLFYAIGECISEKGFNASQSGKNSIKRNSTPKDWMTAQITEIFCDLISLCLGETGSQPKLALSILRRLRDLLDPNQSRGLDFLLKIQEKKKHKPTFPAEEIMRAIYCSSEEYHIFFETDFNGNIQRKLIDDSVEFLKTLNAALNFTLTVANILKGKNLPLDYIHFFFTCLMEPLLTSFALIYGFLINAQQTSKNLPHSFGESWKECLTVLGKIETFIREANIRDHLYANFRFAWNTLLEDILKVFDGDISPQRDGTMPPVLAKELQLTRAQIVTMAKVYKELDMKSVLSYVNDLWRKNANYNLIDNVQDNIDALFFLLSSFPGCGFISSPSIDLRPNFPDIVKKQTELCTFLTKEHETWFRSESFPVEQMYYVNGVLCVLLDGAYPTRVSKHVSSRSLDQMVHHAKRIYETRLYVFYKAIRCLYQNIDPQDRETLQRWVFSFLWFPPIAFIFSDAYGNYQCIQVYYHDNAIIQRPSCAMSEAYVLHRAALGLPVDANTQSGYNLLRIIYDHTSQCTQDGTSSISFSAIIQTRVSLEFFNLLLDLLHKAMELIYRSPYIGKTPLSYALLLPGVEMDNPVLLSQCEPEELCGLFCLCVIYADIFAQHEKNQQGSAQTWMLRLYDFYSKRENIVALGQRGVRGSELHQIGEKDNIRKELEDLALPTGTDYAEHCRWYREFKSSSDAAVTKPLFLAPI